jgi:hypothetical protein
MVRMYKMENLNKDLIIVVPYRDRKEHLETFLKQVPEYFNSQNISYDILVCELDQVGDWNAGLCVNSIVDFLHDGKDYKWLYIHHVDVWPEKGLWGYPKKGEVYHNLGDYGSCLMTLDSFFEVNGYCNNFWGWGGEDNELYEKLRSKGYNVISIDDNYPVKYNTSYQNHERKFNGNNYGGGINNLFLKDINNRDNIKNFYEFGSVTRLPNIKKNIYHQIITPIKKSPREHKNKKLLIGYIHGIKDFMYVAPFVKSSLIYAPYNYDITIIVSDDEENLPLYLIDQLKSFGVNVYLNKKSEDNLFIDRFKKYIDYISKNNYDFILHADVTDTYFQQDPFNSIELNYLNISSEGIKIKDESWNKSMYKSYYNSVFEEVGNYEVLCGGILGAPRDIFLKFAANIIEEYINLNVKTNSGIDQIIIQKLLYADKVLDKFIIKGPSDSFCINLHVWEFYKDSLDFKINIQDGKRVTMRDNTTKYCIVHQFNRNSELYNNVTNHFVNYFYPI